MSLRQKYLTTLTHLAPAGAVGLSAALGAAAPAVASAPPQGPGAAQPPAASATEGVSERLAALRAAVSELDADRLAVAKDEGKLAWGNWGFGYGWPNWPNWNNWRNWNNYWRNW